MMTLLDQEKRHLAALLDAIQRCVYFLDAASTRIPWPLESDTLEARKKDTELFGALAALNERFAKLQDTLGVAMRHAMELLGEPSETFLKVLAFYEKVGVIESIADWQTWRSVRSLAAHAYETDYSAIAEHFNTIHDIQRGIYKVTGNFLSYCLATLGIGPSAGDFAAEFQVIVKSRDFRP